MKLIIFIWVSLAANYAFSQNSDSTYKVKLLNPNLNKKKIESLDSKVEVIKTSKASVSLLEIDHYLEKAGLSSIKSKLDNVDRYLFGQKCLNLKITSFLEEYQMYDLKKLRIFCEGLKNDNF